MGRIRGVEMKSSNMIRHSMSLAIMASLMSCASYHSMESVTEKMDRYHPRESAPIPSYGLQLPSDHSSAQPGRGPASAGTEEVATPKLKYTNKQLYFMTLLDQYYKLGQFAANTTPEIKHCPANHSALITYHDHYQNHYGKKSLPALKSFSSAQEITDSLTKYPELQLPVSMDASLPIVADIAKKDATAEVKPLVQKALDIHLVKTYNELRTLCDTGASDNYYAFENLLNESKKSGTIERTAVMKGAIFSNMALIKSLSRNTGRSIASGATDPLANETMARANANWLKNYLK